MCSLRSCLWHTALAVLAAFLMIFLLSFSASAEQSGVVTATHVRLRSQPTTDSEILAQLEPDDELEILSCEGDWYRVRCTDEDGESLVGYIRSDLFTPVAERNEVGVTVSGSVSCETELHVEADGESDVCLVVSPDDTLLLVDHEAGGGWAEVCCTVDDRTYTGYLPEEALTANPIALGVTSPTAMTFFGLADGSGRAGLLPEDTQLDILDFDGDGWCLVRVDDVTGYVRTAMITLTEEGEPVSEEADGGSALPEYVSSGNTLSLMSGIDSDFAVLCEIPAETVLSVSGTLNDWYLVNYDGLRGFVRCDDVSAVTAAARTGRAVADYACRYLGSPYRWGGTSLTNGADCSGFVRSVYAHFGVTLPHSSYAMRSCGTAVSLGDIQPGDIVCYSGHVGIYVGNGQIVNALNSRVGVVYSSVTFENIVTIRRIFN